MGIRVYCMYAIDKELSLSLACMKDEKPTITTIFKFFIYVILISLLFLKGLRNFKGL